MKDNLMRVESEKILKQHREALTNELVKLGKCRQVQLAEWDIEQNETDYEFYFNAGWQASKVQVVPEGFVLAQKELTEVTKQKMLKTFNESDKFLNCDNMYKVMIEAAQEQYYESN